MPATPLIRGHLYRHYKGTIVRVTGWSMLHTPSNFRRPIVTFLEEGATEETSRPREYFVDRVEWPEDSGRLVPRFEHLGETLPGSTP